MSKKSSRTFITLYPLLHRLTVFSFDLFFHVSLSYPPSVSVFSFDTGLGRSAVLYSCPRAIVGPRRPNDILSKRCARVRITGLAGDPPTVRKLTTYKRSVSRYGAPGTGTGNVVAAATTRADAERKILGRKFIKNKTLIPSASIRIYARRETVRFPRRRVWGGGGGRSRDSFNTN